MNRKLYPLCENHMFLKAYRKGKSAVNKYTAVYVLKNYRKKTDGTLMHTRFGIAVNAKLGKATRRNRVKRMIREAYSENIQLVKDGLIVVIASRGAAFGKNVKSTDISRALFSSLKELSVFREQ